MTPQEYVKNAVRTESPAKNVLERLQNNNEPAVRSFVTHMQEVTKLLQTHDKWKKHLFYGKPLNAEMSTPNEWPGVMSRVDEKFIRLLHGSMGVATEAGELEEALLKVISGEVTDTVNLKEEVGDVLWYLAILCDTLGVDMAAVMETNIAKLKARFPNKFTEENAINRNLDTERKILEA